MEKTCGLAIVVDNKLLVCHATGSADNNGWGIPKGKPEAGEKYIESAVREVFEETGLDFSNPEKDYYFLTEIGEFRYKSKKKKLFAWLLKLDKLDMDSLHCDSMTSRGYPEVDAFKLLPLDEVKDKCHHTVGMMIPKIQHLLDES